MPTLIRPCVWTLLFVSLSSSPIFGVFSVFSVCADAAEPTAGKQVEQKLVVKSGELNYLLYLPKAYGVEPKKAWPLVLFLHGRGESYGPLSLVAKWGPPKFAARNDDLPYILVSPQCPGAGRWTDDTRQGQLAELLNAMEKQFKVDVDRVYLTGLSMGGYGSWELASRHPERFAAVAPVCGGGDADNAKKLAELPIWVWHGDSDRAVPFSRSSEMVKAIQDAGGTKIRFTTLEQVGHNSWSAAYNTPELWSWMFSKKREP